MALIEMNGTPLAYAQRTTVAGAGHIPHMSHPGEYAPIVGSFLLDT
jgi:pimeloyl-ACP methyl ester carboxylesterase